MARKSNYYRDLVKKPKLIAKYAEKRNALREKIKDKSISLDERMTAIMEMQRLPKNSCPVRRRNRCPLSGRPRGFYGSIGLGRIKLRESLMRGEITGWTKSSF